MPSYELNLIIKRLSKPDLVSCLKRVGEAIYQKNGIIRKIEYLGTRPFSGNLYNKKVEPSQRQFSGSFFIFHCDLPPKQVESVYQQHFLDSDIIRSAFLLKYEKLDPNYECTLEEELLPPSYRPSVKKLIEEGRPFQRVYETHDEHW